MKIKNTRPSPIAGRWYPGEMTQLKTIIQNYIQKVDANIESNLISIIVPHAGYVYSGQVAASAYARLNGLKFDRVVVCSPYHAYHPAELLTSSHKYYDTPLAKIRVDLESIKKLNQFLVNNGENEILPIAYDAEHSLEIQLPFLIETIGSDFELLPIMIRSHEINLIEKLSSFLVELWKDKKILYVASTDLSHFYSEDQANIYDSYMIDVIKELDTKKVLEADKNGKGFACGSGAVATIIEVSKLLNVKKVDLFSYATSAAVTGDQTNVVGYAAMGLMR